MNQGIIAIPFLIAAIIYFIRFIKSKKIYNLFVIGMQFIAAFFGTPLGKNISNLIRNVLFFVAGLLAIIGLYFQYKENKNDTEIEEDIKDKKR